MELLKMNGEFTHQIPTLINLVHIWYE